MNVQGLLLVGVKSRTQTKIGDLWVSEYQARIYSGHEFIFCANLEDPKVHLKFFGSLNYILESKKIGEQKHAITVYDFNNKLKVLCSEHNDVKFLEVDEDIVYVMESDDQSSKQIYQL